MAHALVFPTSRAQVSDVKNTTLTLAKSKQIFHTGVCQDSSTSFRKILLDKWSILNKAPTWTGTEGQVPADCLQKEGDGIFLLLKDVPPADL